jgi:hypothetical protein
MIARTAVGLVMIAALAACGPSGGSMSMSDAKKMPDARPPDAALFDFGCGGNTACQTNQVCCAMPGATTTFACVDPASCASGDSISCDGPDECGGATPVCCGVDVPNGTGSFPSCHIKSLGTSCTSAAACPTHLGSSCSDTTKVQICHVSAECTDPQNNMCCTFTSGGAMLTFCIDATTASLGGGVCH